MSAGDAFRAAGQVKLDATGTGQVTLAPPGIGWDVTLVSVTTSTRVKEPVFKLYADAVADASFLQGSFSGSQDASDTPLRVAPGQFLIGVWTGGDAGATATLRVSGTVAGPRGGKD